MREDMIYYSHTMSSIVLYIYDQALHG